MTSILEDFAGIYQNKKTKQFFSFLEIKILSKLAEMVYFLVVHTLRTKNNTKRKKPIEICKMSPES